MHPMISALSRHKVGVVLIVLQVAITLAIVCNSVFIIGTRVSRVSRPTGLDEGQLFVVTQQWADVGTADKSDAMATLDAMQKEDLVTLRALPDVAAVTPINSLPLLNSAAWNSGLDLKRGQSEPTVQASFYFADESVLPTLGVSLLSGRPFTATDVGHMALGDSEIPPSIIVSQAIADRMFPGGNALGKPIYLDGAPSPSTIIGVIRLLQTPGTNEYSTSFAYNSVLVPMRINSTFSRYAVRAKPGRLEAALRAVPEALYRANGDRVIADDGIQTYKQIRTQAYRADLGMAALMGAVSLILLGVTAAGIFALTSFWVDQRERQIGIRRALGASRNDILRLFQFENLLIVGGGAILGLALAIGLNAALMSHYEMARLPVAYVLTGLLVVIVLSQVSTFVPARKASNVEPAIAIRNV